ncbi:hypothetical protein AAF712_005564 [Marasmius tenuissimus]|uniref:Uncharacterized protein n=1 Tax=Marasmius tenuissimus TaxID=585030 RepID=A0ABR3A056_9AGAR
MATRFEDFSFHTIGREPELLKRLSTPDPNAPYSEDEEQLDSTDSESSWDVEPFPSGRPTFLQRLSGGDPGQENDGTAMMEVDYAGPSDSNPSLQSRFQPFADTINASNGVPRAGNLQKAVGKAAAGVVTATHSSSPTPASRHPSHPQSTRPLPDHNSASLSESSQPPRVDGPESRPDSPFNFNLQYPPNSSRSVSPVKPDLARLKLEQLDLIPSPHTPRNRSPSPTLTVPAPPPNAPQCPPRQDALSWLRSLRRLLSSFASLNDTNPCTSQPNANASGSNINPAPTDIVTLTSHAEALTRESLERVRTSTEASPDVSEKGDTSSNAVPEITGRVENVVDGVKQSEEILRQMGEWIREYEMMLGSPSDEDGDVEMEMDNDDDEAKVVAREERYLEQLSERVELAQKRRADAVESIVEARKMREREKREKEEAERKRKEVEAERERERQQRIAEEEDAARERRIAELEQKLAKERAEDAEAKARRQREDEERQRREAEEQREEEERMRAAERLREEEEERKQQEAERKREEEERKKKEADEERKRQEEVEARRRKQAEEAAEAERQRRLVEERERQRQVELAEQEKKRKEAEERRAAEAERRRLAEEQKRKRLEEAEQQRKIEEERAKVQEEAERKAKAKIEDERKQRETLKLRKEREAAQRLAEQNPNREQPQGKPTQDGEAEQAHSAGIHSAARSPIIPTKTASSTSPPVTAAPSSVKHTVSSSPPTLPKKVLANPIAGQTLVPLTPPQRKQQKATDQQTSDNVPPGVPTPSTSSLTSHNTSLSPDIARVTSLGLRVPKPTTSPLSSKKDLHVDADVLNDAEAFRSQASVLLSASSGVSDIPTIHSYDPLDQGNLPIQEYNTTPTRATRSMNPQGVLASGSGNAMEIGKVEKQGVSHPRVASVEGNPNQIPAPTSSRRLSNGGKSNGQQVSESMNVVPKPGASSPVGSTRATAPATITGAPIASGSVGGIPSANASAYPLVPRNAQAPLEQHVAQRGFNNNPSTPARKRHSPSVLAPSSAEQSGDNLFDPVSSAASFPKRERLRRDKYLDHTVMSQSQSPLQVQRQMSGRSDEMFDSRTQSQLSPKPAGQLAGRRKRPHEDDDDGSVSRQRCRFSPPPTREHDPRDDRGQRQRRVSDYVRETSPSSPPRRSARSASPPRLMDRLQQVSLGARLGPPQQEGCGVPDHNLPAVLPPSPTSYSGPCHDSNSGHGGPVTFESPPSLLRRMDVPEHSKNTSYHPPRAGPSKNTNGKGTFKAKKGISQNNKKKRSSRGVVRKGGPGPVAPSRKHPVGLKQRLGGYAAIG